MEEVRGSEKVDLKVSSEDPLSTDEAGKSTVSLKECVDAYDGFELNGRRNADNAAEEQDEHIAAPYSFYIFVRTFRFLIETALVCVLYVFASMALSKFVIPFLHAHFYDEVSYDNALNCAWVVLLLSVPFGIKLFSSRNSAYSKLLSLRIVDKNGERLNWTKSVIRTVVYLITWFLFPIHFLFIVTGSRRFIHDYAAGSYVLYSEEDLKSTFYPPMKPWLAGAFLAGCFCFLGFKPTDLPTSFQRVAVVGMLATVGSDSKMALNILESSYGMFEPNLTYLNSEKASDYKFINEKLAQLREKYCGPQDLSLFAYKMRIKSLAEKAKP